MRPPMRRVQSTAILSGICALDEVAVKRLIIAVVLTLCFTATSMAQLTTSPILTNTMLAKAAPDECFAGVGLPYPAMVKGKCPKGSVPKVNQAYVWGLTQLGTKLWFGTAPNVLCLVLGGYLGQTGSVQTPSYVCEFGASQVAQVYQLPGAIGDWRPPKAYVYNSAGKGSLLNDVTPNDLKFSSTLGLRSAGSIDDTVFLAGPSLQGTGVNFFAFSSSTQSFLGSCQASQFNNIRQWAVINGVLYAGVGNMAGGGGVIRWNGYMAPGQPFDTLDTSATCGFEVVANLAGDAAFLTAYGSDRIAVSAWPNPLGAPGAGVYISPAMDETGLHAGSDPWSLIWQPSMYEPDPVTAATYGGGAIAYWNGALVFGTMHIPGVSLIAHNQIYGPPANQEESVSDAVNTYRAISIWRIDNADTTPVVQLLYGESSLPAYNAATDAFEQRPTNSTAQYGPSGFGNIFNNYTWTAAVFQDRLFFGTMDCSYLLSEGGIAALPADFDLKDYGIKESDLQSAWGADLWRFDAPGPAVAENLNGLDNYLNYGVRSMLTSPDGQSLYIGTANPMNLQPRGGWELWSLILKK